jgi:hypothetical protein
VLQPIDAEHWTARAVLTQTINSTGWNSLDVEANINAPSDTVAAFGAGYVEAALTVDLINNHWQNMRSQAAVSEKVSKFVQENEVWVRKQADSKAHAADAYWTTVRNIYAQLDGMASGYDAHRGGLNALSKLQLMLLGMTVELDDISKAVDKSARPDYQAMTKAELEAYVFDHTHCSAMIKVNADLSELYAAHNTWCSYEAMLRIFKTYTLPFNTKKSERDAGEGGGATTYRFSGYPATIAGIDDFYVTSNKLAVIETTNSVFTSSLFDAVNTSLVMYWVRVSVATRLARSAREWHDYFYRFNSGTYNNQWMTVDYKLFTPGEPLLDGTFIVSEQIPGFYKIEDQTNVLQRGHWPSYNVPFYDEIYEKSGYPAIVKTHGNSESYQLAPRALIFRRDADASQTLSSVQHFMRLNRFNTTPQDPLFPNPDHAIAARADLMPTGPSGDGRGPRAGGAIDCKITTSSMMRNLNVSAIAGPTHTDQPVFSWQGAWNNATAFPHYGHPTSFDFEWVDF